jgi:glycosyltransferase involved in cell wall biosynthesis
VVIGQEGRSTLSGIGTELPGRPRLLFVINDAAFFLSHRLPVADAARGAGFDVHVATPASRPADRIRELGFTYHSVGLTRGGTHLLRELLSLLQLIRLYRRIRPDIVHHATIKPVLYGGFAARLAAVPASVSTITGLGHIFSGTTRKTQLLRGVVRLLYRVALAHKKSTVIFQNPDDLAGFVNGGLVRTQQAVLIRGSGVDLDEFRITPEPMGDVRVVLASRMLWSKGIREFIEAAALLRGEGVTARFALVGGTDPSNPSAIPEAQLRAWHDAGVVEWWGFRTDMPEVLAGSHIVCLPTTYGEGVPKVLIEAAACGRPVVTTDASGCREIVVDGENGFLVRPRDPAAVAAALRQLIEDMGLRHRMGTRGREIAREGFSVETVTRKTVEVYRNLMGQTAPAAPGDGSVRELSGGGPA